MDQEPQQSLQPPADETTPQDRLEEARKTLQGLIDSGLSKDLLHSWVDGSPSLQISLPPPLASSIPETYGLRPLQSPPQYASPQHAPPPPPPQCPPPPPPSTVHSTHMTVSSRGPPSLPASAFARDIQNETLTEDVEQSWPSSSAGSSLTAINEQRTPNMSGMDSSIYYTPSMAFSHRPRFSVSSVSSGSSGHASLWSNNSAQSSFSWQSGASSRSMAPLPLPPPPTSACPGPLGMTVINGSAVAAATAALGNRPNIYWCTSCETSFKRKYDWKRHEDEFHERWRKYPCPEPGCNRSFWGSNSFNQHHKQCHGCQTCPHADKIVKYLRRRKYWACGFCSALHPSRERHVEHVARHFESGLTKSQWMHSKVVYGLLRQPYVKEAWDMLIDAKNARMSQFSWHPSKTGRAQGFLEQENAGQLQDHLEFFDKEESDASSIIKMAYDLADIVVSTGPDAAPESGFSSDSFPGPAESQSRPQSQSQPQSQPPPFATLPSHRHTPPQYHPMLPSNGSGDQGSYVFARPVLDPSSESSQSPLNNSPMGASGAGTGASPLDMHEAREESMMDFEYNDSGQGQFDNWRGISQPLPSTHLQGDWPVLSYYNDPPVTSA